MYQNLTKYTEAGFGTEFDQNVCRIRSEDTYNFMEITNWGVFGRIICHS